MVNLISWSAESDLQEIEALTYNYIFLYFIFIDIIFFSLRPLGTAVLRWHVSDFLSFLETGGFAITLKPDFVPASFSIGKSWPQWCKYVQTLWSSKLLKLIISVRSRRLTAMGEDTIWVGKHLCLPFYSASMKTVVWWSEVLVHAYIYFTWRTR